MTRSMQTAAVGAAVMILMGCNSGPPGAPEMTDEQKQAAILADPMGYKPKFDDDSTSDEFKPVNGGLGKDFNDLLNP